MPASPPIVCGMKPLQAIAMGLVIVVLTASFQGYDALPDPVGWVLVIVGVRRLAVPQRGSLLAAAGLALLVSAAVWLPIVNDRLQAQDPSLSWAANLPQVATAVLLAHALAQQAFLAEDRKARRWLLTTRTLLAVVALLPVLVFGGGLDALEAGTYVLAGLAMVLLIWLLFSYASRPWASSGVPAATPAERGYADD